MKRRWPALALAVFAGIYFWQTAAIPLDPWSAAETINARSLPFAYSVALLILAVALFAAPAPPSRDNAQAGGDGAGRSRRGLKLVAQCTIIAAFGFAIPFAGLWLALAALLAASLWTAGERRLPVLLAVPAGTALAAWLLLVVMLDVYIDPGSLFARIGN